MPSRRLEGLAVLGAVLVLAAGCGGEAASSGTPQVDRRQVEDLLGRRARERTPALAIGTARCPEGVRAQRGESFECTVLVEGEPVRYQITVAEVLGSQVRYDLRPLDTVVDVAGVVNFVRSLLDEHWRTSVIDCGKAKVRIAEVGATIDCTAFNGTVTRYIQAVVDDKDGSLRVREQ